MNAPETGARPDLIVTPPPPCEEPLACRSYDKCARQHLACHDFLNYVNAASPGLKQYPPGREPRRDIYLKVFQGFKPGDLPAVV